VHRARLVQMDDDADEPLLELLIIEAQLLVLAICKFEARQRSASTSRTRSVSAALSSASVVSCRAPIAAAAKAARVNACNTQCAAGACPSLPRSDEQRLSIAREVFINRSRMPSPGKCSRTLPGRLPGEGGSWRTSTTGQ
jgi:hypothetical protein